MYVCDDRGETFTVSYRQPQVCNDGVTRKTIWHRCKPSGVAEGSAEALAGRKKAEDLAWARAVVSAGHRVAHEPRCVVHHAHAYTPDVAFERYRVDAAYRRREWGQRVRPDLLSVARGIAYELREDWRHVRAHGGGPGGREHSGSGHCIGHPPTRPGLARGRLGHCD
jgi:hypothetical protein